ncbi:hypothetical protein MASR2M79_05180 [Aminivibrio sp.]
MTKAGIGGLRIRFAMPPEVAVSLSRDLSSRIRASPDGPGPWISSPSVPFRRER